MTYFFGINFDKKTSPQAKKTYKSAKKTKALSGVNEKTKTSPPPVINSKKTPQAEGMQLGAMLIKQGLVTSMPMPKLAKLISRWNATGRQNKLEEFIKNELPNITSTQASKKSKVSKKKITKKKVKGQKKKNTRREKIKKDDYIPF